MPSSPAPRRFPLIARAPLACGLLPALMGLQAARAAEPDATPAPDAPPAARATGPASSSWSLGLGVGVRQQPYTDVDNDTLVLPLLSYDSRWVRVQLPGVDLKLLPPGPVGMALRVRYDGSGYEASDSPALEGMEKRKAGVMAGVAAQWRGALGELSAEVAGDVSGNSKGSQVKLSLGRDFRLGRLGLTPRLGVTWMDRKYVDYYYGVADAEALATRPAYAGRATANAELGLRAGYGLSPQQILFADFSATRLGTAIQDSPIVDKSTLGGVALGYLYRF
jgi:outer membrane protein